MVSHAAISIISEEKIWTLYAIHMMELIVWILTEGYTAKITQTTYVLLKINCCNNWAFASLMMVKTATTAH